MDGTVSRFERVERKIVECVRRTHRGSLSSSDYSRSRSRSHSRGRSHHKRDNRFERVKKKLVVSQVNEKRPHKPRSSKPRSRRTHRGYSSSSDFSQSRSSSSSRSSYSSRSSSSSRSRNHPRGSLTNSRVESGVHDVRGQQYRPSTSCAALGYGFRMDTRPSTIGALESLCPDGRALIRLAYESKGFRKKEIDNILASITKETMELYTPTYKLWWSHCKKTNQDTLNPEPESVILFLKMLLDSPNITNETLEPHISALSVLSDNELIADPLLKGFLIGVNKMPSFEATLEVIDYQPDTSDLINLSKTVVAFLHLVTGERPQTLAALRTDDIELYYKKGRIGKVLDSGGILFPNTGSSETVVLKCHREDPSMCVVTMLEKYISETKPIRNGAREVFLSSRTPHHPVSTDTLRRWIKDILDDAGIDVNKAQSIHHSPRWRKFAQVYNLPMIDGKYYFRGNFTQQH